MNQSPANHDPRLTAYACQLSNHDWTYEYSDDGRVWRAGKASQEALEVAQKQIDPDYVIWNRFAPEMFKHQPTKKD